jgi:hypothetical protein
MPWMTRHVEEASIGASAQFWSFRLFPATGLYQFEIQIAGMLLAATGMDRAGRGGPAGA